MLGEVWENIKSTFGKRKVRTILKHEYKTLWFTQEVKNVTKKQEKTFV